MIFKSIEKIAKTIKERERKTLNKRIEQPSLALGNF